MNLREEIETALEKYADGGVYPVDVILDACKRWALEALVSSHKEDCGLYNPEKLECTCILDDVVTEFTNRIEESTKEGGKLI